MRLLRFLGLAVTALSTHFLTTMRLVELATPKPLGIVDTA